MPVPAARPRWCARRSPSGEQGGGAAAPASSPARASDRAPEAFRVAPRLRHRRPGREADRAVLRAGLGQGAGRHLHAAKRDKAINAATRSKATARRRCATSTQSIEARREISLERFIYALGIRHVGETTAVALARGYGSWQAFHDASLQGRARATRRRAPRWTRSTRSARR